MKNINIKIDITDINAIGIDVSKDKLDICCLEASSGRGEYLTIGNAETDITKLARAVSASSAPVILESTGRHHLLAAIVLSEYGLDVRVINPLITQKYVRSSIRKVKTDRQDSRMLANIALLEKDLPSPFKAEGISLNIRKKLGLIATLEKQLQQLQSSVNDYVKTKDILKQTLSSVEKQVLKTIKDLKRQKDQLEKEVERDVRDIDTDSYDQIERLTSIPGISLFAATLSCFFFSVDHLDDAKQWIAYSGLDISIRQSGVWQGKGKLTKRGNPFIRKRLFQAAWGAVMNNQEFNDYYYRLKDNGRKHTEAMVIIARKLIRIMFSITKNQTVFDPTKPVFAN